ncbi:hypothetical protein CP97_12930 [Aurantiacibacter atlanticus]|uniref:DUF3429 domain-containing protein n=1 Tax=Aurantiacibacter atlanticus TaxID=1648404 RepID=A0A0H4VIJ5_9SPHN|nr:DUF3429 domain-containing protein [Aurantiacibacter atlanticus]AKQ42749.1 hypothetical protein CP97_12930 [Aurantiacibacter atlanticus]MDF1835387.1 DUF3429 domain-containing protein [Alteraurantiacibacter sp. bin_em_oilr2.035]
MASIPHFARISGIAGLFPQLACAAAVWIGPEEWRWTALAFGWAYAAIIFTFLGGTWWGMASASPDEARRAPRWIWIAAIAPSMIALATYLPWVVGGTWPAPSLFVLGVAIVLSPLVDQRMVTVRPSWWMMLRVPLSLGLGGATLAIALS